MKLLLIGSGGREHALAWALAKSPKLTKLYAAPGNAGIAEVAELCNLDTADHQAVIGFCREHAIDLVVVGPEAPLVAALSMIWKRPGSRLSDRPGQRPNWRAPRPSPRACATKQIFRPPDTAALIRQMPRSPMSGKKVHRLS